MNYVLRSFVLLLVLCLGAGAASAQTFEYLDHKPVDPSWEPRYDPTMTCGVLPIQGTVKRELGVAAALAAAERRELDPGAVYNALLWAESERDPSTAPALRRLVDQYRCNRDLSGLAMMALEALGEPRETFLGYARNWEYNDGMARNAMEVLGVRRDSSVHDELRQITLDAPSRGRLGAFFVQGFNGYVSALRMWDTWEAWPTDVQVRTSVTNVTSYARGAIVVRSASGDSLAASPSIILAGGFGSSVARRHMRRLAEVYPTSVERELERTRAELRESVLSGALRSVAAEPRNVSLYTDLFDTYVGDLAPTALGRIVPAVASASLTPSVCVEERGGEVSFGENGLAAVFSYSSREPSAVRVGYGAQNVLTGARDAIEGKWAAAGGPAPPEVFFPDGEKAPAGRPFRVAFQPGEPVSWTLMGQTVTADATTPRCSE